MGEQEDLIKGYEQDLTDRADIHAFMSHAGFKEFTEYLKEYREKELNTLIKHKDSDQSAEKVAMDLSFIRGKIETIKDIEYFFYKNRDMVDNARNQIEKLKKD